MKIIETSAVTSSSWMPLLGNYGGGGTNSFATTGGTASMVGIDFMQQAYTECLDAIAKFALTNTTGVTVMYGCNQYYTPPTMMEFDEYYETYYYESSPDIYGINQGWIYYQGELYYVQAFPYSTVPEDSYVNATITTSYSAADPAVFSNSASNNIHMIRYITFSVSSTPHTTGDGDIIPDYNNWMFANNNSSAQAPVSTVINNWLTNTWNTFSSNYNALTNPAVTIVGTSGNPQFENGWGSSGLTSALNPLSYYKLFNRVYLWGEISLSITGTINTSVIFHLPPGCHPLSTEEVFAVPNISVAHYTEDGGYDVADTWYIWVQSDGSVTFLGNATDSAKISLSGINFLTGAYNAPAQILAQVTS